jgi:uncharacterized protein (DUF4415 family)/uncharacterized DUF497 family protein
MWTFNIIGCTFVCHMSRVFDPAKDSVNIKKHGISLARFNDMEIAQFLVDDRYDYGEVRYRAWGFIDGVAHYLAFTTSAMERFVPSVFVAPTNRRGKKMPPKEKFNPKQHDDNPDWTAADFSKARPAHELAPEILAQFNNKPGRPKLESPKLPVKLRLDSDLVKALRETGRGWQTRINSLLRSKMKNGRIDIDQKPDSKAVRSAKRKRA